MTDGVRIAELLASEVTGREDGALAGLAVTDADPDAEPTTDGALVYSIVADSAVTDAGDPPESTLAEVYVHPDRARVEFVAGVDVAVEAAADRDDLRVRPKAVRPPRTLVFVESGAAVKAAVDVLDAAASAAE